MEFDFTAENFAQEVLSSAEPVLVDFFADWCGPCMVLMPIIEDLAESDVGAKVGRVNIDDEPALTEEYGVMSVPALLLFKGGKPVQRLLGYHSQDEILKFIESAKQ